MYQSSKISRVLLIFLAIPAIYCFHLPKTPPMVCNHDVCYHGTTMRSFDGSKINAYLGIPYAEPPTEENRFRDPVKWELKTDEMKHVNCKNDPPSCLYNDFRRTDLLYGNEDCLYMNIFVMDGKPKRKPVLMELADIDFERGDASTQLYGPEFIVNITDSIVVMVNSRLGIFGYLAHAFKDETIHGNMGLKDQQMAIEWVHDNIELFGGDPDLIILAGGASVSYHLVNEKSSNLIDRAIIRHSNFITPYNAPYDYDKDSFNLQNYAHLIDRFWKKFSDLRYMNGDDIFKRLPREWTTCQSFPYYRFRPIVEGKNGSKDPFLVDHPISIWSSNSFNFQGDVWYWMARNAAFEWMVPMFWKGYENCDKNDPVSGEKWWDAIEEYYFADFYNKEKINQYIHQFYLKVTDLVYENPLTISLADHSKEGFYPPEQLYSWGQFIFPMIKMIQLRPYSAHHQKRTFKRDFLTVYENQSKYRCFRSVYFLKHLCGDPAPVVGKGDWQARGDELVFLYPMSWYFQSPSQRWLSAFQDMNSRYQYFLHHGFSEQSDDGVPENCHIPRAEIGQVSFKECKYQLLFTVNDKNIVHDHLFTEREKQFGLWDKQLFESLKLQDKVREPAV